MRPDECTGLDHRIGPKFLEAGVRFGGGCLLEDIRDSAELDVARAVQADFGTVVVHDPKAMDNARPSVR